MCIKCWLNQSSPHQQWRQQFLLHSSCCVSSPYSTKRLLLSAVAVAVTSSAATATLPVVKLAVVQLVAVSLPWQLKTVSRIVARKKWWETSPTLLCQDCQTLTHTQQVPRTDVSTLWRGTQLVRDMRLHRDTFQLNAGVKIQMNQVMLLTKTKPMPWHSLNCIRVQKWYLDSQKEEDICPIILANRAFFCQNRISFAGILVATNNLFVRIFW